MHIITAIHSDARNFEAFREWVNSRDYGSRPYCREVRFLDLNIQEVHLEKFLADLKWFYKEDLVGFKQSNGKYKTSKYKKLWKWFVKLLGLKYIDIESVERTPKKWFEKPKYPNKHQTLCFYLHPLFGIPDFKDKSGHEEI